MENRGLRMDQVSFAIFHSLSSIFVSRNASVVKLQSSSASNGEFAGGSPAGCTNSRACGSTRIAEGPDSESGSLGGAIPFMPTTSRRLASAGSADPGDLKSPAPMVLVRIQARQPISLGGEIASRPAYTQESEGQN